MDWFSPFTAAWDALSAAGGTIATFFSGFDFTSITDTGKGITAGLMAFGSYLLAAVSGATSFIAETISDGFHLVQSVAANFGQVLFAAVQYLGYALSQGISYLGNSLYSVGQWVFNAGAELVSVISQVFVNFLSWVTNQIQNFHNAASTAMTEIIGQVNTHVGAFSSAVVDKMGSILTNHLIMGVVERDISSGNFGLKSTGLKVGAALIAGPVLASLLRGLGGLS